MDRIGGGRHRTGDQRECMTDAAGDALPVAKTGIMQPKVGSGSRWRDVRGVLNGVFKNVKGIAIGQLVACLMPSILTGEVIVLIREEMTKMW